MIPKDERDRHRAILAAAAPRPWRWWTSNSHRRLKSDAVFGDLAYGTKHKDGVDDIVVSDETMAAIETAVNRIGEYIDDAEEMGRRIAAIEAMRKSEVAASEEARAERDILAAGDAADRAAVLGQVLKILRGDK